MKPTQHAHRSAKKYGGKMIDYIAIHDFLNSTKQSYGKITHRTILHNTFGCF